MATDTLDKPMTWEDAQASLLKSMDRFGRADVEGILSRYADNVKIRFADLPEMTGKAAAEKFLRTRFAMQKDYKVTKTLLVVSGQKYSNSFIGNWTDVPTGKQYECRGVESIELKDGKVINWDCAYNLWEKGKAIQDSYFGTCV